MNRDVLETAEQCLEKMKLVFNTAGALGLKIKWRKCHFLQKKIYFLGHNIEDGNVRKDSCGQQIFGAEKRQSGSSVFRAVWIFQKIRTELFADCTPIN